MKFLGYTLGNPSTPMPEPDPEVYEKMGSLLEDATKAGVLLATGELTASRARPSRSATTMASSRCWTARLPKPRN